MRNESGATNPSWYQDAELPRYSPLAEDLTTDVVVIGAGIAGLTTAYLLAREGKQVVVIDDNQVGGGESGRTTAHLTWAMDDRIFELEKVHGPDRTRLIVESHMAAVNRIEQLVKLANIDCEFERLDGWLFLGEGDDPEKLQEELAAAHRAGATDVEMVAQAPLPGFGTGRALRWPNQAQFHPLEYFAGLARGIEALGGRIFCGSHVRSIEGGSPAKVEIQDGHTVTAGAVCVCTNSPISDMYVTHLEMAPYRTYVVAFRINRGAIPKGLYWDTPDPYHYVRIQRLDDAEGPSKGGTLHDLLIVGGEDHKTGQATDMSERWRAIEEWTRARFPVTDVVTRWSGQVMEPADYIAFTGPNPDGAENVYLHTGDSGQGMTHGTIAGILLTDLILKRPNPWAEVYHPKRLRLSRSSATQALKENLNVAAQYLDWVKPGDTNPDDIRAGEGCVLRRGAHRIAAYRDESGTLHERSAVCTHLKCVVQWNPAEKSWDCPCHGSRFGPKGEVLNGPAVEPLGPPPSS
ncbi:MAG: FAD-dependent oxidoreductase [Gemmatimonadaceae bacterium]